MYCKLFNMHTNFYSIINNMKKLYYTFLIISCIIGNFILIIFKENILGILGFNASLLLSYALFENKKLLTSLFGTILSGLYIILYFKLHIYAQFAYEIYSMVMFFSLAFRKNIKQSNISILIEIIITIILGLLTYIYFSSTSMNLIYTFIDIFAFLLILTATMFTSRQNILQFYLYIPASILIIIVSLHVHDYAITLTSICFIIADSFSLLN